MTDTTPSPIALDESAALIVIYCTEHPYWRACRFHRDEAQDAACTHEQREHPGDHRHRDARRKRVRRVATATQPEMSDHGLTV